MKALLKHGLLGSAMVAAALTGAAQEARACGGCFHQEVITAPEISVVTGHRMVISVSPQQTVLWDGISYEGTPTEFAWVLPVGPGARIEVASNAFFESLEAVTSARVSGPAASCGFSGGGGGGGGVPVGCASGSGAESLNAAGGTASSSSGGPSPDSPVVVLSRETVGPYESTTVRSLQPGALTQWLRNNAYAVPESISPVISAYEDDGADFLALKLRPGQNVRSMKPVRVVYPGPLLSFPLRMVQAGTGERVGVVLYVIGEGRWGVESGENVEVDQSRITFDFTTGTTNFDTLRGEALGENNGNAWLTAYARRGSLFKPVFNPVINRDSIYIASNSTGSTDTTFADLFVSQGIVNQEGTNESNCRSALTALADETRVVVDPCDATGSCRALEDNEVDMRTLRCGALDDLAVAMVGSHPASVWLTRLEAELPRSALLTDLQLGANARQSLVENNIVADNGTCPDGTTVTAMLNATENLGNAFTVYGPMMLGVLFIRRRARALRNS